MFEPGIRCLLEQCTVVVAVSGPAVVIGAGTRTYYATVTNDSADGPWPQGSIKWYYNGSLHTTQALSRGSDRASSTPAMDYYYDGVSDPPTVTWTAEFIPVIPSWITNQTDYPVVVD